MRIPADALLGEEGQGFKACMKVLDLNRPTIAAGSLGHCRGRAGGGHPVQARTACSSASRSPQFQAIQFKLGRHGDPDRGRSRAALQHHAGDRLRRSLTAYGDVVDREVLRHRHRR